MAKITEIDPLSTDMSQNRSQPKPYRAWTPETSEAPLVSNSPAK
jgi:hypothetical protein